MKNSWNLDKDCSKRFTLYFPGSPIQSDTDTSLGSMQPYAANNARRHINHLSFFARYSFIQLSERGQCRMKKIAQGFNTAAQDSNPVSLS